MHFEKFWLDAVELGIASHPRSQILEEGAFADSVMEASRLEAPAQMIARAGIHRDYGQNNRLQKRDQGFYRFGGIRKLLQTSRAAITNTGGALKIFWA